jgi:hypothetical protein
LTAHIARSSFANLRRLNASHGRQDHTVLPYAASLATDFNQPSACRPKRWRKRLSAVRLRAHVRSRKTALQTSLAPDAAASTATRPNVCDDGQRPSSLGRDGGSCRGDLGSRRSGLFLQPRLDRANQFEVAGENRTLAQRRSMLKASMEMLYAIRWNEQVGRECRNSRRFRIQWCGYDCFDHHE